MRPTSTYAKLALVLTGTVLLPGSANACRYPGDQTRYLHENFVIVDKGEVAAEVEIIGDWNNDAREIEARIIKMLRGRSRGKILTIKPIIMTSCDSLPRKGDHGIVVGRPISAKGRQLIVDPRRATSTRQGEWLIPSDAFPQIPPIPKIR